MMTSPPSPHRRMLPTSLASLDRRKIPQHRAPIAEMRLLTLGSGVENGVMAGISHFGAA